MPSNVVPSNATSSSPAPSSGPASAPASNNGTSANNPLPSSQPSISHDLPSDNELLTTSLNVPAGDPQAVLSQLQMFVEPRIPRLPKVKSVDEWEKLARQWRHDTIENVVLRGQAKAWRDAKTQVEWLDTMPTTSPADENAGYHIRKLRFESLPGMWVPALLYVPNKLEGKVPVGLAVNGHEPEGQVLDYKQIRCINQAKRGMIVLSIEWYWTGQLSGENYNHYRANQLDLCGTSAVAPFYLVLKRGLDILLDQPHADPSRVAV
ncbi:MAG: hypothetical protein FWC56_02645, partial [Phycisphaerae bacterium]|nr:hypothetical protein [Phycisphaerae bacterium]